MEIELDSMLHILELLAVAVVAVLPPLDSHNEIVVVVAPVVAADKATNCWLHSCLCSSNYSVFHSDCSCWMPCLA